MLFRDTPTGSGLHIYGLASVGCIANSAAGSLMPPSKMSEVGWSWSCSLQEVDMTLSASNEGQALFGQK